jgi:hypothetical protein
MTNQTPHVYEAAQDMAFARMSAVAGMDENSPDLVANVEITVDDFTRRVAGDLLCEMDYRMLVVHQLGGASAVLSSLDEKVRELEHEHPQVTDTALEEILYSYAIQVFITGFFAGRLSGSPE